MFEDSDFPKGTSKFSVFVPFSRLTRLFVAASLRPGPAFACLLTIFNPEENHMNEVVETNEVELEIAELTETEVEAVFGAGHII